MSSSSSPPATRSRRNDGRGGSRRVDHEGEILLHHREGHEIAEHEHVGGSCHDGLQVEFRSDHGALQVVRLRHQRMHLSDPAHECDRQGC